METIELKATERKDLGKKASKTIRAQESIPCVLYGGDTNVNFTTTERDFRPILFSPHVYVVNIDIDGKVRKAIIKDIQYHPVSDKPLHVDFLEVLEDKPITVNIPLKATGSSKGVREGGKLVMNKRKVAVKGLYKDIPATIEVDITELAIGKSIRAGEIKTDGNYEVVMVKETPVISVRTTRAAIAAAAAAAKK